MNEFQALTPFSDLLLSLIQGCGEREETALENNGSQTNAAQFKPHELIQSAQRIARYVEICNTPMYMQYKEPSLLSMKLKQNRKRFIYFCSFCEFEFVICKFVPS